MLMEAWCLCEANRYHVRLMMQCALSSGSICMLFVALSTHSLIPVSSIAPRPFKCACCK